MTSVKLMFTRHLASSGAAHASAHRSAILASIPILWLLLAAGGCASSPRLHPPVPLTSPYESQRLWAVVPFVNESGVSHVDAARLADAFTYEIEQIHGVRSVPVNRVLAAMRTLRISEVRSRGDAIAIMHVLEVDGLIVGTITAYDAYAPLKLGMAVELFSREALEARREMDLQELIRSPRGESGPRPVSISVAQASGFFDASNHAVRDDLRRYARGRSMPETAFGERLYDVSIELYTRFVSHRLLHDLLAAEHSRLIAVAEHETPR